MREQISLPTHPTRLLLISSFIGTGATSASTASTPSELIVVPVMVRKVVRVRPVLYLSKGNLV